MLNRVRQRAGIADAFNGQQLADLLQADFCLASGHDGAHALRHDFFALGHDLIVNAQLLEHLGFVISTAGAGRVGNALGIQQHLAQLVLAADVGEGCAFFDGHAHGGAHQIDLRALLDQPLGRQIIKRAARQNHHIGLLALAQTVGNRGGR